ncbi:hypothetical protein V3C99_002471 [Haemonchus contortus]
MGHGSSFPQPCGDSRVVKTKFGYVIGRRFGFGQLEVDAFQGIPFAKPPVGEMRFQKPEWPEPWDDVKVTKGFAARGIQKDVHYFETLKLGKTSEDNLYLNVFTPAWSPDSRSPGFAVLVFIHGGGFICDSAVKYGDVGICEHLCTKEVVVVTIQYRLGFLGFFSTGDEHCPGNLALWDQTLALRWIQENIALFNGDPNNVTVMGQSAGGACVDLLSICPHSRDLFHKVIPIAGNANCTWAINDNMVEECRKFAERNGIHESRDSKKMIDALRQLPASKFALSLMDKVGTIAKCCPVGPRLDFDFISKSVDQLRKEAPPKPMLIGCSASEGLLFLGFGYGKDHSVSTIMEYISELVPESEYPRTFKKLREEILQKFLTDPQNPVEVTRAFTEMLGDLFVNIALQQTVLETLEAYNDPDAPVYFYSYDYYNPKSFGPLSLRWPFKDATHCTELAYIFAVGIVWNFDFNDDDKRMLELTTKMWTNFAKYGDPNGVAELSISSVLSGEKFRWEPATLSNPQRHLAISLHSEMKDEYKKGRPLFITQMRRSMFESYSPRIFEP